MIEAYRIGVRLAMTSNAAQVLGVISHSFLGLNRHINETQAGLGRVRLGLAGLTAGIVGAGILKGMGALVHHGAELVHQQALMKSAGMENREIAEGTAAAWKTAGEVIGTSVSANARSLRELRGILGTTTDAMAALSSFGRASVVLKSVTGRDSETAVRDLAKALELRGGILDPVLHHISPAAFENELNLALKAIIASGGMVDQKQLYNTMQMGGPMARMMNPEQFYKMMMSAIMDMGGYRAGTALQAAGRALYGGIMPQRNSDEMARFGLLDPDKVHVKRGGNVQVDPGALTGFDVLNQNGLFVWVDTVLRKAFEAKGLTTQQQQTQEVFRMFPTDTMRRLITLFLQNHEQVARDAELFDKAQGKEAYGTLAKNDPTVAMTAFHAAWDNLLTALGSPMVESVANVMKFAAGVMNDLAQTAAKHPEAVEWIGKILLGLGAFLVVAGGIAIGASVLALIMGGGAAAAIGGVIAAIATLAATVSAEDWGKLWDGFMAPIRWIIDILKSASPTQATMLRDSGSKPLSGETPEQFARRRAEGLRSEYPGGPNNSWGYAPPNAPRVPPEIRGDVLLDGRKVGAIVTQDLVRNASGPMTGVGSFDGRQSMETVGR